MPLIIDKNATFVVNKENIANYFNKDMLDEKLELEERQSNVCFIKKRGEYQIKKELFKNPEVYKNIIKKELKRGNGKIVADERFGKSLEKWEKELKEKEAKEKPKKKKPERKVEEPEGVPEEGLIKEKPKKKIPSPDKQINQKRKEIEEIERKYNIYYSPVVQDLLGLYYKEKYKGLKKVRKELKELEKEKEEPKGFPEEIPKKATSRDYLRHIQATEKLHTEMIKIRWAVKKGKMKSEKYEEIKKKWSEAYHKTIEMEKWLSEEELKKIMMKRNRERAKIGRRKERNKISKMLKKRWNSFWKLIEKKFGKKIIREVNCDAVDVQLKLIKRLKRIGVLSERDLAEEQKRLEKLLKKYG